MPAWPNAADAAAALVVSPARAPPATAAPCSVTRAKAVAFTTLVGSPALAAAATSISAQELNAVAPSAAFAPATTAAPELFLAPAYVCPAAVAAPAVINEQMIEGKIDAVLNFWHYNARLKVAGMNEIISVKSVLKELDLNHKTPLLGWVFDKEWAEKNSDSITAFLDSSFQTKEILLNQLETWEGLKKKMKADQDDVLFTTLRDAYRDGIVEEFTKDHALSASEVFSVMASIGGEKLVGSAKKLDPETFWEAYIE